ncbi:FAD-dependent oxidoreductase [Streptomyces sp. NBC_00190]|uniref:FAD-binding oxidoreductase n=1 Tax=unclassified Streptomyces TaxID=2593676 RepID=UPI002E2E7035|nr:FAD-dependent oxidoreductase [Streptomyces sp. NBC_00190]WSZ43371.1 FAD-dependent oxidoreductase [Streptomyces sp. NBC_00868]
MSDFSSLVSRVEGEVFLPGQEGFDEERTGFQRAVVHRPDVIVGAVSARDVAAAVRFAGARGLPVAVQATGHGLSVGMDGGVLISTRRMSGVRIDPEARTAWLEAGVRWEHVVPEAGRHGLAPLNGSAPHVGAVSYILGGGLALLGRTYGWAADHVHRMEVVTADAQIKQITPDSDPDLFWALLGGKDNFGIVTGLETALMPQPRIYGGGLYFDTPHVEDILHTWHQWTTTTPDHMNSSVGLMPVPDLPFMPEPLRGRYVAHVRIASTGGAIAGRRAVAPLRAVAPRLMDTLRDMPYTASGSIFDDPVHPHGYTGDNALLGSLGTPALDAVRDLAGPAAPVMCVVDLRHLGGALARPPAVPNAVGHREAAYILRVLSPVGPWSAADIAPVHEELLAAVRPWTVGRNLNFVYGTGRPATAERLSTLYDAPARRRMARLKAVHDPANTFRVNHNIQPDPAS